MIDLTDGDRSAVISFATGAPIRIGFNAEHRWRGLLYSRVVKPRPVDQHRVEYDLCALRALGLDPKRGMPRSLSPNRKKDGGPMVERTGFDR